MKKKEGKKEEGKREKKRKKKKEKEETIGVHDIHCGAKILQS